MTGGQCPTPHRLLSSTDRKVRQGAMLRGVKHGGWLPPKFNQIQQRPTSLFMSLCHWKKDNTQRFSDCVRHKHRGGGGDPGVKKTGRKSHEPFKRVGGRGGSEKHGEGQRGVCSKSRSFHSCFSPSVWRRCLQTCSAPVQVWVTTSRPLQAKQTEWKWNQSGRESVQRKLIDVGVIDVVIDAHCELMLEAKLKDGVGKGEGARFSSRVRGMSRSRSRTSGGL